MRLQGKVALITGGNSGIGFATAQQFVKEGAYVFITGRSQTKLDQAVKRVGSNVTGVQGDVSKLEDLDRLFAQIKKEKGRLDIEEFPVDPWCSPSWVLGDYTGDLPEPPSASVFFPPASELWRSAASTCESLSGASGRQFSG
jgi:short chain dehydrogenase